MLGVRDQFKGGAIALDNALAFQVMRVYQSSRRAMYRAFAEHGVELTPEQWAVLVRLWERDARTQGDLATSTARDAPTMSRIIDVMARMGLVRRALDPEDGRTRIIVLTDEGRALKSKLVPVVEKLVARMEAGISERDLEITRRTLARLADALE